MQKYFRYAVLLLTFAFVFVGSNAQQPAYFMLGEEKFKGIHIYDVIQDKEQNYWFATNEGLYLFDYYTYTKVECGEAKSDAVFGFKMNAEGTIYCHNLNNQIFEIKGKKCKLFYELKEDEGHSDISLEITDNGQLIIGGKKGVILNQSGTPVLRYHPGKHFLGPAYKTASGAILYHISFSDSVLVCANGKFERKKLNFEPSSNGISNTSKFFTVSGISYALDLQTKKLYRFNQATFQLISLPDNPAFMSNGAVRLYETKNELWIAGSFMGVMSIKNPQANSGTQLLYEDFFVSNVYQDNEGNILISTFDKGVLVIPDILVSGTIHSFRDNSITSVYSDSEAGLLLGTAKGILMNYKDNKTTVLDENGTNKTEAIYGYQGSDLILFSNGKIKAYNKKTKQVHIISELSLKDAVFISKDEFYIGTNRGVYKIKWNGANRFSRQRIEALQQRVYSMEYDKVRSCLYTSTATGLYKTDSSGVSEKILWKNQEIFTIQLFCSGETVYASTRKNGILVIRNGKVVSQIFPLVNGKVEVIGKLIVHENSIFASSSNGFFRFDMNGNLITPIHTIYGFSQNKTFDFTFEGNQLWVCHSGGVQLIDLNYAASMLAKPIIRFNSVYANDKGVDFSHTGEFESDKRKIAFIFSSPTLRNRGTTHYHYKLIGYDTSWIVNEYEANNVIYNALAPGNYIMQVKAENQGQFSDMISYSFSIAKPFYSRWWFIGSCIILFLAAVYSIYKWQLNIQQRKLRQINELNASKLTAIQSQMNPHFIFNSLNSIQDLILKGDVENSYSYITTFSNLVRRTLNYSDKDFIDFDQEIKLLELYLSLEKLRFKKTLKYEIVADNITDILLPPLLIQPFIENALVHGLLHKEGEKILLIKFELTDVLICTIEDNGIGREKSKLIKQRQRSEHESFSGKAIRKRFEILSTVLEGDFGYVYEDLQTANSPSGTRVILTIPVKRNY
jgi:ligand-binding sensor domain-containing protein